MATANSTGNDKGKQNREFYEKVILLIIGFVLTGVVGTFISFYFQSKTNYNNYKLSMIESERKVAKEIFEDVTSGMDSRVYSALLVNNSRLYNYKEEVKQKYWLEYVNELGKWNNNITKRKDLVRLYFYDTQKRKLDDIHNQFIDLNILLKHQILRNDTIGCGNISLKMDRMNGAISGLSHGMIVAIQNDAVGRITTLKEFNFWGALN
ncbi:hypothetical protein KXQ82_18665 [Mucilaginibacter sp. HMF5004]|uniref:hypothetical protein n=1 Tax=Mucilaginibacter rivuli TaxID=2857527 RepID=UPI001C5D458A|nr:hypothetical protein [Mucilaginibacter rivuli]MBW4891755.1 hypothetical protein [Mucilaginibacter rivuli]